MPAYFIDAMDIGLSFADGVRDATADINPDIYMWRQLNAKFFKKIVQITMTPHGKCILGG